MKRAKRTIVILGLALAGCRGPLLSPTATPYTVEVHLPATTGTYPLLQDFIQAYRPAGVLLAVDCAAAGWDTIYARLRAGDVPYALTTTYPPDSGLWAAPVGWDGLAVIVHPTTPVPALSLDELRRVFQGRIRSWGEVGGPDVPVTVVSREDGSASRRVFERLVMGEGRVTQGARLALSSAGVVDVVASVPGAVGYVSLAYLDARVHAVPLSGPGQPDPVLPTPGTISAGTYALRTPILVVGPQPPAEGSIYYEWFAWMQSSAGQQVVGRRYGVLAALGQ